MKYNILRNWLVILVMISLYSNTYACSCFSPKSFDIGEYDVSTNIIEISVLKRSNRYAESKQQYEKRTLSWDKPYPQPPMYPPPPYDDFIIDIINIHKGDALLTRSVLRSENNSCKWEPRIGETYIVYLDSLKNKGELSYFSINSCHRKINRKSDDFFGEVKILKHLKEKPEGEFELFYPINPEHDSLQYKIIFGSFKNKSREDKWVISEPVFYQKSKHMPIDSMIVLSYNSNKLIDIEYNPSLDRYRRNRMYALFYFYFDQIEK